MFTHSIEAPILVIHFKENLTMPTLDAELQQIIENAIEQGILHCVIDLEGVQYANSSGIGILMRILAKFRNANGEAMLVSPSTHLQKLLIITKLSAIFSVFETLEEAKKAILG
ncbi:MAG: anti-sigma factor antagonist [Bacteroidetes bacterium]|nr:MAG: anti-sigma factor antagonist [Bacteroidota bacterium]